MIRNIRSYTLQVMSASFSSSYNASLLVPPAVSSSISLCLMIQNCVTTTTGTLVVTPFSITSIFLLLPLYILVLHLGLIQWRQQRSNTKISHSDLFTIHMVVMELLGVSGSTLLCFGGLTDLPKLMSAGICILSINFSGQLLFHVLTCVERYLAVIHPITYLSLRKAKGIRIRNITIGCVWLMCFAGPCLLLVEKNSPLPIFYFSISSFFCFVISFCSLSVLRVLIRPGPGKGGGGRQRVDQSKLRAFFTILAISGVLLIKFGGSILATALYNWKHLGEIERCGMVLSTLWFSLPSSLVLPLIFLHRAGKLMCWKNKNKSSPGSD